MKLKQKFMQIVACIALCAVLVGCNTDFAKTDYNDDAKIARDADQCVQLVSTQLTVNENFKYTCGQFDGRLEVWKKNIKDNNEISLDIELSVKEGNAKVVLVNPDGKVQVLAECADGETSVSVTDLQLSLKSGKNRIKVVGYECKDLEVKMNSEIFEK